MISKESFNDHTWKFHFNFSLYYHYWSSGVHLEKISRWLNLDLRFNHHKGRSSVHVNMSVSYKSYKTSKMVRFCNFMNFTIIEKSVVNILILTKVISKDFQL